MVEVGIASLTLKYEFAGCVESVIDLYDSAIADGFGTEAQPVDIGRVFIDYSGFCSAGSIDDSSRYLLAHINYPLLDLKPREGSARPLP